MNRLDIILDAEYQKRQTAPVQVVPDLDPDTLLKFPTVIIVGAHAAHVNPTRTTLMKRAHVRFIEDMPFTPGRFARAYLRTLDLPPPDPAHIRRLAHGIAAPLYAKPCELKHAVYVDIRSAYFALLTRLGYGVKYARTSSITLGAPVDDFPLPEWKPSRNALLTTARGGDALAIVDHMKPPTPFPVSNTLARPATWLAVHDVLHAIAAEAVRRFDAVYVHTDGYILPEARAFDFVRFVETLNLSARIAATGPAEIRGVGAYVVGDRASKKRVEHPTYHCNITPPPPRAVRALVRALRGEAGRPQPLQPRLL